ncbi:MAG: DUF4181 domain-containing protein [Paenisporosarcina sp.]
MFLNSFSPGFEGKIIIWLIGCLASMTIINAIMRKVLSVERKKFFSYNFINDSHKKGEWVIRISFTIILISIAVYDVFNPFYIFAAIGFGIFLSGFRVIFEKKYAENPKDYIYTLSEMGFAIVIILVMTLMVFPEYLYL